MCGLTFSLSWRAAFGASVLKGLSVAGVRALAEERVSNTVPEAPAV